MHPHGHESIHCGVHDVTCFTRISANGYINHRPSRSVLTILITVLTVLPVLLVLFGLCVVGVVGRDPVEGFD